MSQQPNEALNVLWEDPETHHYVCDECYAKFEEPIDWSHVIDDWLDKTEGAYQNLQQQELDCEVCSVNKDELEDIKRSRRQSYVDAWGEKFSSIEESVKGADEKLRELLEVLYDYSITLPSSSEEAFEMEVTRRFAKEYASLVEDHRRGIQDPVREWSRNVAGEIAGTLAFGLGLGVEAGAKYLDQRERKKQTAEDIARFEIGINKFAKDLGESCKQNLDIDDSVVDDLELGRMILAIIIDHHNMLNDYLRES